MKKVDVLKLKEGDKVIHRHLGICTIKKVVHAFGGGFFGLVLVPDTTDGKLILCNTFGLAPNGEVPPYLEGSTRLLTGVGK